MRMPVLGLAPCLHAQSLGHTASMTYSSRALWLPQRSAGNKTILRMLSASVGCCTHERDWCTCLKPEHCRKAPLNASYSAPRLPQD